LIAVTPSLYVGVPEDHVYFSDLYWADNAQEAARLIEDGHSALIAEDETWQYVVTAILRLLGASPKTIAWAIETAPRVNEPAET